MHFSSAFRKSLAVRVAFSCIAVVIFSFSALIASVQSAFAATVNSLVVNPHTGVNNGTNSFDTGTCVGSTIGYSINAVFTTDDGGGIDFYLARVIDAAGNLVSQRTGLNAVGGTLSTGDFIQATAAVRPFTFQILDTTSNGGTTGPVIFTLVFDPVADANLASCASLPLINAGNPTAQDKSNTVAALQSSLDAVTTGLLDGSGLPLNGNGASNGNGFTFSPTGPGFNQSRIASANPLDRDYGAAFAPQGYFASGATRQRGNGFNFSVDLQGLAAASAKKKASAPGYGAGGAKDGPYQPRSRLNSWVKGEYVDFDDDETNADRDGELWVVTSGLSYKLGPATTAGVLSRYREGEADSTALNASLDLEAWGGGAFLTTTLGGGLRVAIAGLYEMGDNDIAIAGASGSFDSETTTIEGRVDKRITRGSIWIEPSVALRYVNTEQDNYTDSAGTLVTNQDLTLGRLTYGPTIGTTIMRGGTQIRPFAKINGVWDFENEGNFTTTTAGTFVSGDNAVNLGGGVEVQYAGGLAIKLSGDWYGFDSDLEAWSISGGVGAPLSVFGLGSAGLVSLNLAANGEDASAQARITIPLGRRQ